MNKIIKKSITLRICRHDPLHGDRLGLNSAMILLAAAAFFRTGTPVTELEQANSLLAPLLGNNASVIFAVALLFAGISSTITSGMAAGSIFAGIYKEPYDIKDSHSPPRCANFSHPRFCPDHGSIESFPRVDLLADGSKRAVTDHHFHASLPHFLVQSHGKYKNSTYTKWLLYVIGGIVTLLNVMLLISFL